MAIRTFTVTIGKVYNGTEECKTPHVELAGKQHIAVNCIDPAGCKYSVQLGPNDVEPCLTFLVTCEECGPCGTKVIKKCFCDSVDDCESCEICDADGFCDPTCPFGICTEGICYECNEEVNCTCNKICKNGECTCPPGTKLNEHGCCDECQKESDCGVCSTCTDHGAYNSCEPKECNCDATGKCGTKGGCVECTNSGHCNPNEVCDSHCECKCAPGYSLIQGVCTPNDCPNGDEDCGVCEICVGTHCIPNQCPAGKVPVEVNGICSCVEECNCEQPNCSSRFNFCGESSIPGKCGCQQCTGNCDEGCDDPCVCDEKLNKCKFNPCFGSCESGLDCGPTCGCKDGQCVPCDILDCSSDDCSNTLGCTCSSIGKCVKDTCDSSPCSVAADCSLGCTCDDGVCNACSNYSCNTSDCSDHDGCACDGGECGGDKNPVCDDSITIEKDDAACTITGTLIKKKCCQCPAITLDVRTLSVTDKGTTAKTVVYRAEVRKGAYDGVSVDSNPLVDAFTNPAIASNEPPTAGTIRLSYSVSYEVFNIVNGKDIPTGQITASSKPFQQKTYGGSESQKDFNVELPNIQSYIISGNQKLVVKFIELTFSLETKMVFPNNCEYPSGTEIGKVKITSNDGFSKTPVGTTIKSNSCRLPFIKWTKFPLNSLAGNTFRKIYLPATTGNTYIDTIEGTTGAESCFTYLFEPDCSCDDPAQKYIVFCNPIFNKPVLENCGRKANIVIEVPCSANQTKDYEIYINGATNPEKTISKITSKQEFTIEKTFAITSIRLHMKCDSPGECDTIYTYPDNKIDAKPTYKCVADGTITYSFDSSSYPGGIASVTFDGILKTSNFDFEGKTPNTNYKYQVVFNGGCVSAEKTANESCCKTPELKCRTGGKYEVITNGATEVKYNNQAIPSDGIITPPASGVPKSALTYKCNNTTSTLEVPPFNEMKKCCNIVLVPVTNPIDVANKTITVGIASQSSDGTYNIKVKNGSTIIATTTATNDGSTHVITISTTSTTALSLIVEIQSEDGFCSTSFPVSLDVNGCDLGLTATLKPDDCILVASTKEKTCPCDSGSISGSISAITEASNNQLSATFNITPVISNVGTQKVIASNLKIKVNGGLIPADIIDTSLVSLTPSAITRKFSAFCATTQNSTQEFTLSKDTCSNDCGGHTHKATVNIPSPYTVTEAVIASARFSATPNGGGSWTILYTPNGAAPIILSFLNTDTNLTYKGSTSISATILDSKNYSFVVPAYDCYLCGGTKKGAKIELIYTLELEDGCKYSGTLSKDICVGESYSLSTIGLTNSNPSDKKVKFELYSGNTLLQTDYKKNKALVEYSSSTIDFKPGQVSTIKASCNCMETVTNSECFKTTVTKYEPTGSLWGSNCNRIYGLTVHSCYEGEQITVKLGLETKVLTIASGVANAVFTPIAPITSATVPIEYSYKVNGTDYCTTSTTLPNDFVPKTTVTIDCTSAPTQIYNATISVVGGGTVAVIENSIPSGITYDHITGATIYGITSTNTFYPKISINGECEYSVPVYADCSCNITNAVVTSNSIDICAFKSGSNGYTTSDKTIPITVTRTDINNDWWAAIESTTLGTGNTASSFSIPITGAQLITLAPNEGANVVNLKIKDSEGSTTPCKTISITINRTNVQYTANAVCGSNHWSVEVTSTTSPVTIQPSSNPSSPAGTVNGQNIINIPLSTSFVKFKVKKGTCIGPEITINIPSDCAPSCSSSDISFDGQSIGNPCSLLHHDGEVILTITTSNSGCPITSLTSAGSSSIQKSGDSWTIKYPYTETGFKTITANSSCGCSRDKQVSLSDNCCGQAATTSISTTSANYCDTGDTVTVNVSNPYGFDLHWLPTGFATGTLTNTGGTLTIAGAHTEPLTISARVFDPVTGDCNINISTTVTSKTCNTDLCTGISHTGCQTCSGGELFDILDGQQGPCDSGYECCTGHCVAKCVVPADSYTSGCTYNHYWCGTCGSPSPVSMPCVTLNSADGAFGCNNSGVCGISGGASLSKNPACVWSTSPSDYRIEVEGVAYIANIVNPSGDGTSFQIFNQTHTAQNPCKDSVGTIYYKDCSLGTIEMYNYCIDNCVPCFT